LVEEFGGEELVTLLRQELAVAGHREGEVKQFIST
jgi:hypothetical protein